MISAPSSAVLARHERIAVSRVMVRMVAFARAAVRVVWNPAKRRAFLLGSDLPTTVGPQVYEMWAIGPDHVPVPAGWFRVGEDGIGLNATGEMAQIPSAQLFAVSSEAHGPQQKPSSVVMVTK